MIRLDAQLLWAALFGWYVVFGAGSVSLDRTLERGLTESALPTAATVLRVTRFITKWFGPVYLLMFRAWLALAMLVAASGVWSGITPPPLLATVLPLRTAAHIPFVLLSSGACCWLPS